MGEVRTAVSGVVADWDRTKNLTRQALLSPFLRMGSGIYFRRTSAHAHVATRLCGVLPRPAPLSVASRERRVKVSMQGPCNLRALARSGSTSSIPGRVKTWLAQCRLAKRPVFFEVI